MKHLEILKHNSEIFQAIIEIAAKLEINFMKLPPDLGRAMNSLTMGLSGTDEEIGYEYQSIGDSFLEAGKEWAPVSCLCYDAAYRGPNYDEHDELGVLLNLKYGIALLHCGNYGGALERLSMTIEDHKGNEDTSKLELLDCIGGTDYINNVYAHLALAYEKLDNKEDAVIYAMKAINSQVMEAVKHGRLSGTFSQVVNRDEHSKLAKEIIDRALKATQSCLDQPDPEYVRGAMG